MSTHDHRWTLAVGQVQRLQPGCGGRWLAARQGRLWLTRTGGGAAREADVWLEPGQRQWLAPGTEWLVEGGAPASAFVLLEPPPARAAEPAARTWRRLAPGV